MRTHYHDKWLILLGVPLINLLNYYLTYPAFSFDHHFFTVYSAETAQGYAAWYASRVVIAILDRYYSWERSLFMRMVIQVPAVCLAMLAATTLLARLSMLMIIESDLQRVFDNFNISIFLIWGFFLNVLYLSLYLYDKLTRQPEPESHSHKIWVKRNGTLQQVAVESCSCFFTEQDRPYALTTYGKENIDGYSLEIVEKLSDPARFFRVNRRFLIAHEMVKTIRREVDGKVFVVLRPFPGLPEMTMVSPLCEASFEQWVRTPVPVFHR